MSDTNEPVPVYPPSNPNRTADNNGYRAAFYPGFVRKLSVWNDQEEQTLLYEQPKEGWDSRFYLPPGFTKPWATSTLEFSRPTGRRIVLQIEDPDQQIDRILVYLKSDAAVTPHAAPTVAAAGAEGQLEVSGRGKPPRLVVGEDPPPPPPPPGGVVLVVEDGPVLCPPACPS